MAYTLDTGHPLYGNIVECIGVESGALVSLVTPRTFTEHVDSSYVTGGTYGEAFRSAAGGFTAKGASFTPQVSIDALANPNLTVMFVFISAAYAGGGGQRMMSSGASGAINLGVSSGGFPIALQGSTPIITGADDILGAHSVTIVRNGTTSGDVYVDGALDTSGGAPGVAGTQTWNYLCGQAGAASIAADLVWVVWLDKALTPTEISDLHTSLGANNAFGLVTSGGGDVTAPVLTSPTGVTTGTTTATVGATTDEDNGTQYAVVTTSATAPSAAQVKAGQDHTGSAAVWAGNAAISTTGAHTHSATGLTASTAYYAHLMHEDAATNQSNVVSSAQFTTNAAGTTIITDILRNNAGTPLSNTSVSWTWFQSGRIGALNGVAAQDGTGTTDASAKLSVTGVVTPGLLLVAYLNTDATDDAVYYEAFL